MMIRLTGFAMVLRGWSAVAEAQMFQNGGGRDFKGLIDQDVVISTHQDEHIHRERLKETSTADEVKAEVIDETASSVEQAATEEGIVNGVSEEERAALDNELRDKLKGTLREGEAKENVRFLSANNYLDKVMNRRHLQQMGENYNDAAAIAEYTPKAQVNPKDNEEVQQYIYERAGVPEEK